MCSARSARRCRLAGGVAVLATALVLAGSWAAPPPAAADPQAAGSQPTPAHPEVAAAREQLDRARGSFAALTAGLDEAAAAFEQAQAHHLSLAEELAAADAETAAADAAVQAAVAAFTARVAEAYKRPDPTLNLGAAVLDAPDPATALHRTALIASLGLRDPLLERAEATRGRAGERRRQHEILAAGVASSAAARQQEADALAAAVGAAHRTVGEARDGLAAAQAEAAAAEQRRAEAAERRRAEQAAAAAWAAAGATAPPPVEGKVCPVGTPNGFIDSWGSPRSGGRRHEGVDIFAAAGTPLYAVADGVVQRLTSGGLGGLAVHLAGEGGERYYYAHLASVAVQAGQRVGAGEVVGAVGNTGNARTTPAHLHWEYEPAGGPPANPYPLARSLCRG